MSGSNWRKRTSILDAFGIILVLTLVAALIAAIGFVKGIDAGRDQVTAREHYKAVKNNSLDACVNADRTALVKCVAEAVEASHAQVDSRQDLYAQKDMASYAFWMLIVSALTLLATAVGVFFVKRTLDATIDAVEDTGIATQAMIDANQIAREVAHVQTRPYLLIDRRNVEVSLGRYGLSNVFIRVPMQNFGSTPAMRPSVAINCMVRFGDLRAKTWHWENPLRRHDETLAVVGPGQDYRGIWRNTVVDEATRNTPLPQFSMREIINDKSRYPATVTIDALFTYKNWSGDVLGHEFYRVDATVAGPDEWAKGNVLPVPYDPQGAGDVYPIG